jgi:1-acyl-sn-glycerol-3-phosphate acyltransferase
MNNRAVRTAITIFCFVAFGVGGTLLSVVFFPLLRLAPGALRQKRARARTVVGFCFGLLVRTLQRTGCMRLETSGLERLSQARGALILANHPSYIDVVVLISLMPQANCVVKSDLWRNPFYWNIVRATGYINNASPEEVLASCARVLQENEPLILFPEGTRTVPGEALHFQRGAARVALRANSAVVPVLISCVPSTLTKGDCWWLAPERPFTFRVEVRELMPASHIVPAPENSAVGARRFTEALQSYFSRELNEHGYA